MIVLQPVGLGDAIDHVAKSQNFGDRLVLLGTAVVALGSSTIGFGHLLMTDFAFSVVVVAGTQAPVAIHFTAYGDESDPGPYPVPAGAPIEGGAASSGDRHVLVIDRDHNRLYELDAAYPNGDGSWNAACGAVFQLDSNLVRPGGQPGWTSADAAGLPILPGLVRFDEAEAGSIDHAIRFTCVHTRSEHLWPARHDASRSDDPAFPPMGQRFRLHAAFDLGGFDPPVRAILQAMKTYGLILADNGSNWFVTGTHDPRWDDEMLASLSAVKGSDLEAVDVSSLLVDPDSGLAVPRMVGDINGDGAVNGGDLAVLLGAWGSAGAADLNGDGTVDAADLSLLLGAWTVS
mgnify:CR=1 FL=1